MSLGPDHLQVFGRGTDNRIWTNIANNGMWNGWQSLGAADALTAQPTVLPRAGGIDVYYRGVDTRPYFRRFNGTSWEGPVKLGEIDVEGTITAVNAQLGHVILFIRSSDDEVYYNFTDGVAPWRAVTGTPSLPHCLGQHGTVSVRSGRFSGRWGLNRPVAVRHQRGRPALG